MRWTPAHTPLWLILLRMTLAALVVFALAHPLLNPNGIVIGFRIGLLHKRTGCALAKLKIRKFQLGIAADAQLKFGRACHAPS